MVGQSLAVISVYKVPLLVERSSPDLTSNLTCPAHQGYTLHRPELVVVIHVLWHFLKDYHIMVVAQRVLD